jgi:hypothetical protein
LLTSKQTTTSFGQDLSITDTTIHWGKVGPSNGW